MTYNPNNKKHSFEDVKAWQLAREFRKKIYQFTKGFPKQELYCLINQLRRASISIHANIAEGYGRFSFKENIQFCRIARGSLNEVLDLLYVAKDELYVTGEEFKQLYVEGRDVELTINGYIGFLRNQQYNK